MSQSMAEIWEHSAHALVDTLAGDVTPTTRQEARAYIHKYALIAVGLLSVWTLWGSGNRWLSIGLAVLGGWQMFMLLVMDKVFSTTIKLELVPSRRVDDTRTEPKQ